MLEVLKPNPVPANIIGTIDYYRWRHVDFITRCEDCGYNCPEYYLELGERYLFLFKHKILIELSEQGKKWVDQTALELQIDLENILRSYPDIELNEREFNKRLYISHFRTYFKTGFHKLPLEDKKMIFQHINYSDIKKLLNV